jgi:hypothetical protein
MIVLFGLSEEGKPRAARFPDDDPALLSRAAIALGLRLGIATKPKHFEVARKLPLGRIYSSGKGTVPEVSQELYDQLNALVGGSVGPITTTLPKTTDEIAPGHLVLAEDELGEGYFPVVVEARSGDTLTVRWRDEPSVAPFERSVANIALMYSKQ